MTLLILGIALFVIVHLVPMFPGLRQASVGMLGENLYKIVFSLLSLLGIVFIVIGWQRTPPVDFVYQPPHGLRHATMLLVLIAFILLAAANTKNNIKRFIRHPMLSGVIVWGIAHLLANGELRSVILFGAFVVWALLEIMLSNARDGVWQKPAPVAVSKDILVIVIGVVIYAVVLLAHPWLFGVPVLNI